MMNQFGAFASSCSSLYEVLDADILVLWILTLLIEFRLHLPLILLPASSCVALKEHRLVLLPPTSSHSAPFLWSPLEPLALAVFGEVSLHSAGVASPSPPDVSASPVHYKPPKIYNPLD